MLAASTRASLARSGASPAFRVAARRTALPRTARRFQSSITEQAQASVKASEGGSSATTHVFAGVAGGLTVLLLGYGTYQFSSIKKTVDAAQSTHAYMQQTKNKVTESVSAAVGDSSPSEALKYLRRIAQSYVSLIPGAGAYIDATFDEFDRVADQHGEEAEKILKGTYEEVQDAYKGAKKNGVDAETATKVADILRRRLAELYELGKKAGGDVMGEILEKHPELKDKVGGGYDQLQKLAESKGPEAKKMLEDTQKQIKEIFAKGFSLDAADQARKLIQEKSEQLRSLAEPAAQEAWDKATEQAKPYLDKVPEIQDLLSSKSSAFLSAGAATLGGTGAGSAKEIFERVKGVAEAKGKEREQQLKELKSWLEEKANEAQETAKSSFGAVGWEGLLGYVKKVPGGEEMLKKVPNAQALVELSQNRGDDAKKLAQETWDELLRVLDDKGKKAKELAQGTKEEAKEKSAKSSKN